MDTFARAGDARRSSALTFIVVSAVAAALGGCAPAIPPVDPASPAFRSQPAAELARLSRGREEYIAKCSGCHSLYRPSHGSAASWNLWMATMAERSKVGPDERERILAYLSAACCPPGGDRALARP